MTVTISALNAALQSPIVVNQQTGQATFSNQFVRFLNNLVNDRTINTGTAQPVTIASGIISVISGFSYYSVTVQTGATDDLDTISNANEGDLLFLKAADATETIVIKDGTGNIATDGSVDLSLDDDDDLVLLHYDGVVWKAHLWNISA